MRRHFAAGYLSTVGGIALFATVEVSTKLVQKDVTPYQLNFFRTLFGAVLLYLLIAISGGRLADFTRKNLKRVVVVALLWSTMGSSLYFLAITLTSASHAALIFSANPVFASLIAFAILHERMPAKKIFGILLGLGGMVAVITKLDPRFLQLGTLHGDLLMIIPLILWSFYIVYGVSWTSRTDGRKSSPLKEQLSYLCSTLSIGLIFLLPITLLDICKNQLRLTTETMIPLLYLGVVTNGFAYLLYFWGISRVGVSKGTIIFFLKPVLAAMLSFLIMGENVFAPNFLLGMLLIFLSILTVIKS